MRNKDLIKIYPSGRKLFDWMEGKQGTVDFVDKDDCVRVRWEDGTTTAEPTKDGKIDGFIDIVFDAEPVQEEEPEERYIVRRLTPLECCRLQGFPDWWCDGVAGSDSAQYKMWGNGMALPNIAYIMYGFAEELEREEMEMLGV